jgi:hypothetical protein
VDADLDVTLFKRRPPSILPSNIVQMMERFGRHEIDVLNSTEDPHDLFQQTQQPLIEAATSRPAEFIKALADACLPAGGWAVYGASRTVVNLIGNSPPGNDWFRILDASNEFLRANLVPPMRVPGYAWNRFQTGGTANTWIALRPPPSRDDSGLRLLDDGEVRRLLKLGTAPDANVVFVTRQGDDYVALIDAPESSDDPTRTQRVWKRSSDQYDLYVDTAVSSQVWDWAAPEIEPFMPTPKALI